MSSAVALVEQRGPVTIVTMNRPDRRNALSRELVAELTAAFSQAATNATRCVILTGQGTAFCAGMDLAELSATLDQPGEAQRVQEDAGRLAALLEMIYTLPKPTIAAINGPAVAGGAGLVSVCDFAVAVPSAKLGYPEVKRGLVAAMVMPHILRLVGERAARNLLISGRLFDAAQALQCGLISNITEATQTAMEAALALALELCESAPQAVAVTKRLLLECRRDAVGTSVLARESAEARLHVEAKEGLRAFLEKRSVPWLPSPEIQDGKRR
jgi:methylglutaconyl-CoA hydratase